MHIQNYKSRKSTTGSTPNEKESNFYIALQIIFYLKSVFNFVLIVFFQCAGKNSLAGLRIV
jgi:hypothetical protein